MIKTCEICGQEFETIYPNKKYCSKECSREAARRADKLRKRQVRGNVRENRNKALGKERQGRREKWDREIKESRERDRIETEKRAEQGDPKAIMKIHNMLEAEYWRAYKEDYLADEYSVGYTNLINGIDIREENAPELIAQSVKDEGRMAGKHKRINKDALPN